MAKLIAEFTLDKEGAPQLLTRSDLRHYRITLRVVDAPRDSIGITYHLHETYYDPVREVNSPKNDFAEEITAYGNFDIVAEISRPLKIDRIRRSLYSALKESHPAISANDKIKQALNDIREN